jgi:hypothetical protein
MPRQRRGRVAVERGADGLGDIGKRHVFGVEDAVTIVEMVHERAFENECGSKQRVEDERLVGDRFHRPFFNRLPGAASFCAWIGRHRACRGRPCGRRPKPGRWQAPPSEVVFRHQNPASGHEPIHPQISSKLIAEILGHLHPGSIKLSSVSSSSNGSACALRRRCAAKGGTAALDRVLHGQHAEKMSVMPDGSTAGLPAKAPSSQLPASASATARPVT